MTTSRAGATVVTKAAALGAIAIAVTPAVAEVAGNGEISNDHDSRRGDGPSGATIPPRQSWGRNTPRPPA